MIKLIVSDLDGTLLNSQKQLPNNFHKLIHNLSEHNIKFIAASGRPVYTLKHNFKEISNKISYIGDNGGVIDLNSGVNVITPICNSLVKKVIKHYRDINIPGLHIILCGANCAYVESTDTTFNSEVDIYYINKKVVENIESVNDDIVKITFYSNNDIESITYNYFSPLFSKELNLAISGSVWLDIMANEVNKGEALKKLQEKLCILPQETIVFGDYYNDIEMFKRASYSFAMANSPSDVKCHATEVIGSNDEDSVVKKIEEFLQTHIY